MAKQIKVIKCPNCGSVEKKVLKEDHYRCENCNTDYFLDNDDINININDRSNHRASTLVTPVNKIVLIVIAVIVFAAVIIYGLLPSRHTPPQRSSQPATTTQAPTVIQQQPDPKQYQITYPYCSTLVDGDRAYVLTLEKRSSSSYGISDNQYFFVIYDLLNEKSIKEIPLENIQATKNGQVKWEYLDFSPSKVYFTLNNRDVYLLDKNAYTLIQVTKSLLDHHPEYQTGIASVTISRTTSGDALHILTNDGKKVYYYPLIDQVYEDNYDFHMVKNRPAIPPADTTPHTVYGFAHNYGQDYKLVKFTYVSPDGQNHFQLNSSKVGKPVLGIAEEKMHTDADSAYDIINNSNLNTKVISHKNLTPGRLYFAPAVIFFDDSTLIIKAKMNAAPDADYHYQRIDINSGNVVWTLPDDQITIKEIIPMEGNFIAKTACNQYALVSADGKLIKQIIIKGN